MSLFDIFRIVRNADLREIVLAQVVALIETNPDGLRVDMNGTAQKAMPNLPAALAHQLTELVLADDTESDDCSLVPFDPEDTEAPAVKIPLLLESLELDWRSSVAQRDALELSLNVFPAHRRYNVLYRAIREAVDRKQLYVRTTAEEGHVCRVVTYWQDLDDRRISEEATTATD